MKKKSTNNTFTVAGILIQIYISSQILYKDKLLIWINTIKAILFYTGIGFSVGYRVLTGVNFLIQMLGMFS